MTAEFEQFRLHRWQR